MRSEPRFTLVSIESSKWDDILSESDQGSAFANSTFISSCGLDAFYLGVTTNDSEVLAALPILVKSGTPLIGPPTFSQYIGPVLSRSINSLPNHRKYNLVPRMVGDLINAAINMYGEFGISCHHSHSDLRGVVWIEHESEGRYKPIPSIRYTARLDLNSKFQMRDLRSREIKKALKSGWTVRSTQEVELLINYYIKMFERQGTSVSETTISLIREITRTALGSKKGVMYAVFDRNGDVGSVLFFLLFKKEAYYLIGANNPTMRNTGASTYLFSESFKELKEFGIDFIDFVGVNSPNRGDYKTSFGAELYTYFDFSIRRVG